MRPFRATHLQCPDRRDLQRFLDEELSEAETSRLEEHLSACEACGSLLRDLIGSLAGPLLLDDVHQPAGLREVVPETTVVGGPDAGGSDPGASDRPPEIPDYEILERLGAGGMGVVYLARRRSLDRLCALKLIQIGRRPSADACARFRGEAKAAARVLHVNVVPVYHIGEFNGGRPFVEMEYVAGGSLDRRLDGTPWQPARAASLVEIVARAVHVMHRNGILHRDLKPGNILLTGDGVPKVADFGLAKVVADGAGLVGTGEVVGTPSYMAPEQAEGRSTKAADIYALGAVIYTLIAGRAPFHGATAQDTLEQVRRDDPVPPCRLVQRVPKDLDAVCLKCLAKDPAKRYASAESLADDLRRFLNGEPTIARPASMATRAVLWCRRNRAQALAGGSIAIALVAVAVFSANNARDQARAASLSAWDRGRQLCDQGDVGRGLLLLADALDAVPHGPFDEKLRSAIRMDVAAWQRRNHVLEQVYEHPAAVQAVAVDPTGSVFVTGCADGNIRLWDVQDGTCRWTVNERDGPVSAIAFGKDRDTFVIGRADGVVTVWSVQTQKPIKELRGHVAPVYAVAISPEGDRVLAGGDGDRALLWDLNSNSLRVVDQPGPVRTVGFSQDGNHCFTGGGDTESGELRVYELRPRVSDEPSFVRTFRLPVRAAAIGAGPTQTLLVGDDDWDATFFDLDTGAPIAKSDSANGRIRATAFAFDGTVAIIGAHDSNLAILWDVAKLRELWNEQKEEGGAMLIGGGTSEPMFPALHHPAPVTAVSFVPPDGRAFLTGCEDGYVRRWRRAVGPEMTVLDHGKNSGIGREVVRATAVDQDGRFAATGDDLGNVLLWDLKRGDCLGPACRCSSRVQAMAFTPDGRFLLVGEKDGRVRFWDREEEREAGNPILNEGGITGMCLSPDGDLLVIGGGGVASRWDVRTRELDGEVLVHGGPDVSLATAVSPAKDRFLTAGEDGLAKLWGSDGHLIGELRHQNQVRGSGFSPVGRQVVTASDDGHVRIWDAADGTPLAALRHDAEVFSAAFVTDDLILTCARGGAQIWSVPHRRPIGPSILYRDDIMHAACTPNGRIAVLADWDGYGVVWQLPQPVVQGLERLKRFLEADTGMHLEPDGNWRVLTGPEWKRRRHR